MTSEHLRFYANTKSQQNKLFSWQINSIFVLKDRLIYFMRKFEIKAAWYVVNEDGIITSQKINLNSVFDELIFEPKVNECEGNKYFAYNQSERN